MIVICKAITGNYPPLVIPLDNNSSVNWDHFVSSREWFTIDSTVSGYSITKGNHYRVYGMFIFDNQIRYLMFDDNNIPGFFPSMLFGVVNNDVDFDWRVCEYIIDNKQALVVGYPALTESYRNIVDLVRCTNDAVSKLLAYKAYLTGLQD